MTGVPPFALPGDQVRPTWLALVIVGTFSTFLGESGVIKITAPFPPGEVPDDPITLVT
jgi:hypothetical protein